MKCLGFVWYLDKFAYYIDDSQLHLMTNHNALKWIWSIKLDINIHLFKWNLILNSFKDKVIIIYHLEYFYQNIDSLSHNSISYNIILIHLSNIWKQKFVKDYQENIYFQRIIRNLKWLYKSRTSKTSNKKEKNSWTRRSRIIKQFKSIARFNIKQ